MRRRPSPTGRRSSERADDRQQRLDDLARSLHRQQRARTGQSAEERPWSFSLERSLDLTSLPEVFVDGHARLRRRLGERVIALADLRVSVFRRASADLILRRRNVSADELLASMLGCLPSTSVGTAMARVSPVRTPNHEPHVWLGMQFYPTAGPIPDEIKCANETANSISRGQTRLTNTRPQMPLVDYGRPVSPDIWLPDQRAIAEELGDQRLQLDFAAVTEHRYDR